MQRPDGEKLLYIPWDFNYWAKQRGSQILTHIAPVIKQSLAHTGLFICAPVAPATVATAKDRSEWVRPSYITGATLKARHTRPFTVSQHLARRG